MKETERKQLKALDLTIKVWDKLAKTGVEYKPKLPKRLYHQIENENNECPLCTLYIEGGCKECPLAEYRCMNYNSLYDRWANEEEAAGRKEHAGVLAKVLKKHRKDKYGERSIWKLWKKIS